MSVPKLVTPLATPDMMLDPDFVMLPLASGLTAVGRTRMFCQVSVFGTVLLELTVNVSCVEVKVSGVTPPLTLLLMFFEELGSPLIIRAGSGQQFVSKMKPAGTFRMIV